LAGNPDIEHRAIIPGTDHDRFIRRQVGVRRPIRSNSFMNVNCPEQPLAATIANSNLPH
jgi:hypothetical protein